MGQLAQPRQALPSLALSRTPLPSRMLRSRPTASPAPISSNSLRRDVLTRAVETYTRDVSATPRLIQHKNEAFWFYRFLSIVYDHIVNPGHWTEDMRADALSVAKLDSPDLKVSGISILGSNYLQEGTHAGTSATPAHTSCIRIRRIIFNCTCCAIDIQVVDVGGGTGFCTLGVVEHVKPENVTLIDQSPHQLAKAKQKPQLKGVTILEVRCPQLCQHCHPIAAASSAPHA